MDINNIEFKELAERQIHDLGADYLTPMMVPQNKFKPCIPDANSTYVFGKTNESLNATVTPDPNGGVLSYVLWQPTHSLRQQVYVFVTGEFNGNQKMALFKILSPEEDLSLNYKAGRVAYSGMRALCTTRSGGNENLNGDFRGGFFNEIPNMTGLGVEEFLYFTASKKGRDRSPVGVPVNAGVMCLGLDSTDHKFRQIPAHYKSLEPVIDTLDAAVPTVDNVLISRCPNIDPGWIANNVAANSNGVRIFDSNLSGAQYPQALWGRMRFRPRIDVQTLGNSAGSIQVYLALRYTTFVNGVFVPQVKTELLATITSTTGATRNMIHANVLVDTPAPLDSFEIFADNTTTVAANLEGLNMEVEYFDAFNEGELYPANAVTATEITADAVTKVNFWYGTESVPNASNRQVESDPGKVDLNAFILPKFVMSSCAFWSHVQSVPDYEVMLEKYYRLLQDPKSFFEHTPGESWQAADKGGFLGFLKGLGRIAVGVAPTIAGVFGGPAAASIAGTVASHVANSGILAADYRTGTAADFRRGTKTGRASTYTGDGSAFEMACTYVETMAMERELGVKDFVFASKFWSLNATERVQLVGRFPARSELEMAALQFADRQPSKPKIVGRASGTTPDEDLFDVGELDALLEANPQLDEDVDDLIPAVNSITYDNKLFTGAYLYGELDRVDHTDKFDILTNLYRNQPHRIYSNAKFVVVVTERDLQETGRLMALTVTLKPIDGTRYNQEIEAGVKMLFDKRLVNYDEFVFDWMTNGQYDAEKAPAFIRLAKTLNSAVFVSLAKTSFVDDIEGHSWHMAMHAALHINTFSAAAFTGSTKVVPGDIKLKLAACLAANIRLFILNPPPNITALDLALRNFPDKNKRRRFCQASTINDPLGYPAAGAYSQRPGELVLAAMVAVRASRMVRGKQVSNQFQLPAVGTQERRKLMDGFSEWLKVTLPSGMTRSEALIDMGSKPEKSFSKWAEQGDRLRNLEQQLNIHKFQKKKEKKKKAISREVQDQTLSALAGLDF